MSLRIKPRRVDLSTGLERPPDGILWRALEVDRGLDFFLPPGRPYVAGLAEVRRVRGTVEKP